MLEREPLRFCKCIHYITFPIPFQCIYMFIKGNLAQNQYLNGSLSKSVSSLKVYFRIVRGVGEHPPLSLHQRPGGGGAVILTMRALCGCLWNLCFFVCDFIVIFYIFGFDFKVMSTKFLESLTLSLQHYQVQ